MPNILHIITVIGISSLLEALVGKASRLDQSRLEAAPTGQLCSTVTLNPFDIQHSLLDLLADALLIKILEIIQALPRPELTLGVGSGTVHQVEAFLQPIR